MKKQFFRVKQLADQHFSRAEKTDTLTDDLIPADKRIDYMQKVCKSMGSKIIAALPSAGQDIPNEKRLVRCPDYILAEALVENNNSEGGGEILKDILMDCSKIELCLARINVATDSRIETEVCKPIQHMENDLHNINKQKRNLSKLVLDMDATRNRFKNSNSGSSTNKTDTVKDELIELEKKVEQNRDSLACEMFNAILKEAEIVKVLMAYLRLKKEACETTLNLLNEMIPEFESKIENSTMKPVFRTPLQEHLKITNRKIALPIELCVCVLLEMGMAEEGLFRVTGASSKVRRLKLAFDVNSISMETAMEYRDVHIFSSVLKSYFRELPEPILTNGLYEEWLATIRYTSSDEDTRLTAMWKVLHKLPQANFDNLRYLIKFLFMLTLNQEKNKMTPQNLAIVIAPSLVGNSESNDSNPAENMMLVNQELSLYSNIVEYLIKYADWFFPGEEKFYVHLEEWSTTTKKHTRSSSADMRLINLELTTIEPNPIKRCQSTTSLEDQIQNCPLPESPKPVMRTRKNKPAPIPPVSSLNTSPSSAASTVTITCTPKEKLGAIRVSIHNSPKYSTTVTSEESSSSCRESFDFNENSEKSDGHDEKQLLNLDTRTVGDDDLASEGTKRISIDSMNKIAEGKRLSKPVPAPRISLENQVRTTNEEAAIPRKPTVPEKPATLPRPVSCVFKSSKGTIDSSDVIKLEVEKGKGPSLQKAHLYTVNKQQVSFIDIASNVDDGNVFELSQNNSISRSDETEKSESSKQNTIYDCGTNSSHSRTLSDGHNIDTSLITANLHGHRSFSRVQRPIPPPPPPPIKAKPQSRPGSVSDSTNL